MSEYLIEYIGESSDSQYDLIVHVESLPFPSDEEAYKRARIIAKQLKVKEYKVYRQILVSKVH